VIPGCVSKENINLLEQELTDSKPYCSTEESCTEDPGPEGAGQIDRKQTWNLHLMAQVLLITDCSPVDAGDLISLIRIKIPVGVMKDS
jgi:hypothetical protein